jgi:hypothetical protein
MYSGLLVVRRAAKILYHCVIVFLGFGFDVPGGDLSPTRQESILIELFSTKKNTLRTSRVTRLCAEKMRILQVDLTPNGCVVS